MVQPLIPNPTKADEVKYLQQLVNYFARRQETYLADLFSAELVAWFARQVADDWFTDLAARFNQVSTDAANEKARADKAERRVAELEPNVAALYYARLNGDAVTLERDRALKGEQAWKESYKNASETLREVYEQRRELTEQVNLYQANALQSAEMLDEKLHEIDRLKARMFDMMTAAEEEKP